MPNEYSDNFNKLISYLPKDLANFYLDYLKYDRSNDPATSAKVLEDSLASLQKTISGTAKPRGTRDEYLEGKKYFFLRPGSSGMKKYLPSYLSMLPFVRAVIVTHDKDGKMVRKGNVVYWFRAGEHIIEDPNTGEELTLQGASELGVPGDRIDNFWGKTTTKDFGQPPKLETAFQANYHISTGKKRSFTPVKFIPGKDYRHWKNKDFTEGLYARHYPDSNRSDLMDLLLSELVEYPGSGRPGHCSSSLGLNSVDIGNFGRSYPAAKKAITNASTGLYETIFELAMGIPALASSKLRRILTLGTKAAKFAKTYLAWELAIHPSLQAIKATIDFNMEQFGTFRKKGFSVYTLHSSVGSKVLDVHPIVDPSAKDWFIKLARSNPSDMRNMLLKVPKYVNDVVDLSENNVVLSDYSITLHLGDIMKMSLERQFVLKHGGYPALLAYDLSPISFFADWFTHIWKTALVDRDLKYIDELYLGTYSNKLTLLETGLSPQISQVFYRKCFDPIEVEASVFEENWRKWSNSLWRVSIVTAILATVS